MRKKNTLILIGILALVLAAILFFGMRKTEKPDTPADPVIVDPTVIDDPVTVDPGGEDPTIVEPGEPGGEPEGGDTEQSIIDQLKEKVKEDGEYDSKEEVAVYLVLYGKLPSNYITKSEARKLGWSSGGLDKYADGKCIGGDRFGNNEGLLPEKKGRKYYECDIGTQHQKSRGAKRIVYSNDGLIYYTDDHYESFELLYGDEGE